MSDARPIPSSSKQARTSSYQLPARSGYKKGSIAVVGTGVVGMTAALGLTKQGLDVVLAGELPSPARVKTNFIDTGSRVYALSPASRALLEYLGVWPELDSQRLNPVTEMQIVFDEGKHIGFTQLSAYQAAVPALAYIVQVSDLERALVDKLGHSAVKNIAARFNNFQNDKAQDGHSGLMFSNGEIIYPDLTLACDGAQSAVRQAVPIEVNKSPYGDTAVVAHFSCTHSHLNIARQIFSAQGVLALLPLPGQHVSLVWSVREADAQELLRLSAEQLADKIESIFAEVTGRKSMSATLFPSLGKLQLLGQVSSFPLMLQTAKKLTLNRLLLAGDAAHVVHPLAGQGLNLGLDDISCLLDLFIAKSSKLSDPGNISLLQRYERSRLEAVQRMAFVTDGLHHLLAQKNTASFYALLSRLAPQGMNFINRSSLLKKYLIQQAIGQMLPFLKRIP